jgi:hypothetical protein
MLEWFKRDEKCLRRIWRFLKLKPSYLFHNNASTNLRSHFSIALFLLDLFPNVVALEDWAYVEDYIHDKFDPFIFANTVVLIIDNTEGSLDCIRRWSKSWPFIESVPHWFPDQDKAQAFIAISPLHQKPETLRAWWQSRESWMKERQEIWDRLPTAIILLLFGNYPCSLISQWLQPDTRYPTESGPDQSFGSIDYSEYENQRRCKEFEVYKTSVAPSPEDFGWNLSEQVRKDLRDYFRPLIN